MAHRRETSVGSGENVKRKTVTMIMHRLNARGGHERSTLEVLTRLARTGWAIELVAFEVDDWPTELPLRFHQVPAWHPPAQLFENLWFAAYVLCWSLLHRRPAGVRVTMGVAAARADVRIVQFLNCAYLETVRKGLAPLPDTANPMRRLYQRIYTAWEAWRERRLLPRSQHLVANSHRVRADLETCLGARTPPVTVVHNGTDHAPDTDRDTTGAQGLIADVPVIVFVGALERKGIDKALRALALTTTKRWRLGVLGEGQIGRWQAYADRLGIGDQVTFFGFQRMAPFWQAADLLLFPSTYEPFGLVVSEAAGRGVIPIASSECGAMELWPGRPDWLNLSATSSDAEWAHAIDRLVTDPNVRARIARDAHDRFLEWTWSKVAEAYANVLTGAHEDRA